MTATDVVPFGKYKGQPIELLLADRSYREWLAAQPWFRERYAPVYNIIIGAGGEPQDTPEHNAMQARYLNHDEALRIAGPWLPTGDALREQWQRDHGRRLTDRQRANLVLGEHAYRIDELRFEAGGWDLILAASAHLDVAEVAALPCECVCDPEKCANSWADTSGPVEEWSKHYHAGHGERTRYTHCADDCPVTWRQYSCGGRLPAYDFAADPIRTDVRVAVELKPVVGDDYPTIMRTVLKRMAAGWRADHNVVLADRAQFASVTLDQVRAIFASQGVTFLTAAELASPLTCSCSTCQVTP